MAFNNTKFQHLSYHSKKESRGSTYLSSTGTTIETCDVVRDLGIFTDPGMRFKAHIDHIIKKAKSICAWIFRTFESRDKMTLVTLWKALVLPILEYCSQVWSPSMKGDIQNIEAVQRSFTARINGLKDLNYWERLGDLNNPNPNPNLS